MDEVRKLRWRTFFTRRKINVSLLKVRSNDYLIISLNIINIWLFITTFTL